MKEVNPINQRIAELVTPRLLKEAVELVDLDYRFEGGRWVLRIYLDKAGGITLDDCVYWSEQIGRLLDLEEVIRQEYVLEVSSPGLDRPLTKETDYRRFLGREIRISLHSPKDNQRNFRGKLIAIEEGRIRIIDVSRGDLELDLSEIAQTRLIPEI